MMNAVDILDRCRDAAAEIGRLTERRERLMECATSVTSHIGRSGGRGGSVSDKVASFAADLDECERQLSARKNEYDAELLAACRIVDTLGEPECGIMYRYYVQGQTVSGIAQALNYSVSYVKQKKRGALAAVRKMPEATILANLPEWYREKWK